MSRLREIRVVKRITQFRLRLETGISPTKISLAENGLIELSENEKKRLAAALLPEKKIEEAIKEVFGDGSLRAQGR
jgi:transcriptional regulator with XRE-family HTH domain